MSEGVSPPAVLARINRKLRKKDLVLRKCRNLSSACAALGDYYLMDSNQNLLIDTHVNLEKFARDEGCLAEWEVFDTPKDATGGV